LAGLARQGQAHLYSKAALPLARKQEMAKF